MLLLCIIDNRALIDNNIRSIDKVLPCINIPLIIIIIIIIIIIMFISIINIHKYVYTNSFI